MDFWERLKQEIKRNDTTQEWLAKKIDVPFGTLRKWLSRQTMPNADQAVAMAEALGTTVEYLVTGEKPGFISNDDKSLLEKAYRYRKVIETLDSLPETIRDPVIAGMYATAETAKMQRMEETKGA